MKIIEIFEDSVNILRTNKLRTGLSALGIIIGISSVIALMTMGQASQQQVENRIKALGSNLLTISINRDAKKTLTNEDMSAILESTRINTIKDVAGEYSTQAKISYESTSTQTNVFGITSNYLTVRNIKVETGREINDTDQQLLNKVAVIGKTLAEDLFKTTNNALQKEIKIGGNNFIIIGITEEKGQTGRVNIDESIFIPLNTAQKSIFGGEELSSIYVTAKDENSMDAAQNQLGYLLMEARGIKDAKNVDYRISSQEDILETISEVTSTFTTLLTGIAAISLVVGGIGIMNIMLVTVTERTKEIGIRKALGAKRKTIIIQFLVEALILTTTGGLLGIFFGIVASIIIIKVMSLPFVISYTSIALSFIVSSIIGVLFGWYPAQRASKLQPIEALRYE